MQQFKIGDWVYSNGHICQITEIEPFTKDSTRILIHTQWATHVDEVGLWQPKVGELFWGTRTLHPDYQYEARTELFQVKHIQDDGTLSLISPLDRNVYSLWIQPENLQEFMKTAEPFIGELPSFLKETK